MEINNFIYIDHNIIQYDYDSIIRLNSTDDYCFVYSDEHFNEFNRKEDDRFFDVLRRIKARKIKIKLDSKFQITNEATVLNYVDPRMLYDQYLTTIEDSKKYTELFKRIQPYCMGNKDAIIPEQVKERFISQQNDLLASIEVLPNDIIAKYGELIEIIGENLNLALQEAKSTILPIEKMRKKISSVNLSELKKGQVKIIDQIWDIVKDKFPGISKDQLFGKEKLIATYPSNDCLFLKIVQCHSILNTLGYYPDKGLTLVNKVNGINSDASHIAHSIFCSALLSADDHLCKKAIAIFEYYEINTSVLQLLI
jgi:hypothetical protein